MSDRDRLVELLKNSPYLDVCYADYGTYEKAADNLLSNGVIAPPCKIGDKIYMLVTKHTHSFEFDNGKMVRKNNQHTFIKQTYLAESNFFRVLRDFGKTVFLTREEAEQALRERKNNVQTQMH